MSIESLSSLQPWLMAGLIFLLRVCDMSLDTLRMLVVMRGRKLAAWVLGFFQAAIFVLAIPSVLKDLSNLLNVLGYAAGFATGNVVGMKKACPRERNSRNWGWKRCECRGLLKRQPKSWKRHDANGLKYPGKNIDSGNI